MKLKSLLVMMFTIGAVECIAQSDTLTLKRCIEIGIENNLTLQQKQQDIHIAEIGQSENRHKLISVIQGYRLRLLR